MVPTEKALIRKIFVCYDYNLFVYVLTAYGCIQTVYKQSKLVRLYFSSCKGVIDTSFQSFTLSIKKTLAKIKILWLLKLGITMLIHSKGDIVFVTEFPCLLWKAKCIDFKTETIFSYFRFSKCLLTIYYIRCILNDDFLSARCLCFWYFTDFAGDNAPSDQKSLFKVKYIIRKKNINYKRIHRIEFEIYRL